MTTSIKVGIAGCGVITQRTLPGLLEILRRSDAALVGACDVDENNVARVVQQAQDQNVAPYRSIEDMLSSSSIDAVLVATPIALHPEHVEHALGQGKHVYTHKTLAPTAAQCEALSSLARSKGLRLAASPGQVLLPAYRRATEIIRSGELGDLVSIDASAEASAHRYEEERADENPPPDRPFSWQWYHSAAKGGGPLDDMFVYPLAFLTALFGSATSAAVKHRLVVPHIEWKGRQVAADAPDAFCGLLMFQEIPTTFRSSFSSNTRRVPWGFISIRGTDAALEIEKCNDLEYRLHLRTNEGASHTESHDVFSSDEVHLYGKKECHVLTDLMEFFSAVKDQRDVKGATATNAAQVAQTLSLMKASARADGAWHNADHEGREQR